MLQGAGVETRHHLPGVGGNLQVQLHHVHSVHPVLQDHLEVYLVQECLQPVSLYSQQRGLHRVRVGLQWFLNQTGDGATTHLESGAFLRSRAEVSHPDIQVTGPTPAATRQFL